MNARPVRCRLLVVSVTLIVVSAVPAVARSAPAPAVLFVDQTSGPTTGGPRGLGVPITIYGRGFGRSRGASRVTIGGRPVARYVEWGVRRAVAPGLETIVVQPGRGVRAGRVVVRVGGRTSAQKVSFVPQPGRVWFVAPGGVDGTACSSTAPCATVSHALQARLRPGDTLLVRGGTYDESEIWVRASGTAQRPIVIKAAPGARPTLRNASRPFIVDADHVTVAGFAFVNGKSLGIPDTGLPGHRGVRLIDNAFVGTIGFSAVDVHGDDHLVAGNACRVSGSTVGTQGHCFYVSYGAGVALRFNVASGAPGYGIHVFDQKRSDSDFRRRITRLVIEGNTLHSSTERSGLILAMGDEAGLGNGIDGVTVVRNTIFANNHTGILVGSNTREVRIVGNTIRDNGRQAIHVSDDATVGQITITGNTLRQSTSSACRSNCTWYQLAHIGQGARARQIVVRPNRFVGTSPQVVAVP